MSDRDKKLILGVLIVCIALLPYFFYIKDKKVETETIENENVELRARLAELQEMDANRQWYLDETARYNAERDAIVALFPADIQQPNYIMFLLNSEYSSVDFKEDGTSEWVYPFRFGSYSFQESEETSISATDVEVDGIAIDSVETVETGYIGLTNYSSVTYACKYEALKYMLAYLMDYKDPVIYKTITMKYDDKTGQIDGSMILAQYAIAGGDDESRKLDPVDFHSTFDGVDVTFDMDDLNMRGNKDHGVFGPYEQPLIEQEKDEEEADAENAEESNEGNDETPAED